MAIPNVPRTRPVVLSVPTRHHSIWGKRDSFKRLLRFLWPWEGKVWHPITPGMHLSGGSPLTPLLRELQHWVFFHNKILLNSQWDAETWSKAACKTAASSTSDLGQLRRQPALQWPFSMTYASKTQCVCKAVLHSAWTSQGSPARDARIAISSKEENA